MKRAVVLHPILYLLYFLLALASFNIGEVPIVESVRSLLLLPAIAAVLLWLVARLVGDWHIAGLLCSLALLWATLYQYAFDSLNNFLTQEWTQVASWIQPIYKDQQFFLLWTGLFGLLTVLVFLKGRGTYNFTRTLNFVALVMLVMPLITIVRSGALSNPVLSSAELSSPEEVGSSDYPDIYYIIFDAYGRSDVLQEYYNISNATFIQQLENLGLTVLDESMANYHHTKLTLLSTLNMSHLDVVADEYGEDTKLFPLQLIEDSRVKRFLKSKGYTLIAIDSGIAWTQFTSYDYFFPAYHTLLNTFEGFLVRQSILNALSRLSESETHRGRIRFGLNKLTDLPETATPKFVFAHLLSPHPPFVFTADGGDLDYDGPPKLWNGEWEEGGFEAYRQGYAQQVDFISNEILNLVPKLIEQTDGEAIIIIQGDHGPGLLTDYFSLENTCLPARMPVLNAIYLPDGRTDILDPAQTLINTFPILLNAYVDGEFKLQSNEKFFSYKDFQFDFTNVTELSESQNCDDIRR